MIRYVVLVLVGFVLVGTPWSDGLVQGTNVLDVAKAGIAVLSAPWWLSRISKLLRPWEPALYAVLLACVILGSAIVSGNTDAYSAAKEFILSLVVFLALIAWEFDRCQWSFLVACLGAGCSVAVFKGWFGLGEAPATTWTTVQRASFEEVNTNHVAYACVACLGLVESFWVLSAPAKRQSSAIYVTLAQLGMAAVLFFGILISATRGAILSIAGMVLALAAHAGAQRRFRRILFLAGAGTIMAAILLISPTVTARFQGVDDNLERAQLWPTAWELFLDQPLLGIGVGQFPDVSGFYKFPHNGFLSVLAEFGLLGFVCCAGLVLSVIAKSFHGNMKWATLTLFGALLPIILTGVWERNVIFFLCLAFIAANGGEIPGSPNAQSEPAANSRVRTEIRAPVQTGTPRLSRRA